MFPYQHRKPYMQRVEMALHEMMAVEIEAVRSELIRLVASPHVSLVEFTNSAIAYWTKWLGVDRIFVCDMQNGDIVAGWNTGKNIIRMQDWDPSYVPLNDDQTLQAALESDELIQSPVDGVGTDLAFSISLADGNKWLFVFDQTDTARTFSPVDMAYVGLVRDLIELKSRIVT
ncbi:MAG: hypothetical protein KDC35_15815 [Acidobacteria bacterium]|nr:hypothetical protein [Acidobacteriota bacterium]